MLMALNHGGNPAPPNNPGIDGTGLTITPIPIPTPPTGADTWVVPVTSDFEVAMEFTLSGFLAPGLTSLLLPYKVTYTFAGLGVANGPPLVVAGALVAGELVYGAPSTTAVVSQTPTVTLPVGNYEVVATVSFAPFPMVAFIELPVLEIFTP
jgi:hypothetical protein